MATSERNLFASGLLPTRTPADVYRALALQNDAASVVREQIGTLSYLVAGTSIATRELDAMLTVPLTSRELQIEDQIDTLDRRVLLGALLFVFAGAAIGYWLAERIADPVNRLTRATGRIARGDLDARIVARSSDEFRRLVDDFNRMAGELQRQQKELRAHPSARGMGRDGTPGGARDQEPADPDSAECRASAPRARDRGRPLGAVLDECVNTILTQVRLLRQIASEFSSFASSPTARPASVGVSELIHEAVDPYRAGLADRIRFDVDVPGDLPRGLRRSRRSWPALSRTSSKTRCTRCLATAPSASSPAPLIPSVRIQVSDTGVGMDAEALARAFEPYFSTKTTGTGLGLPIAKRNVELNGGTISVVSERDQGTTVELTLPIATS